MKRSRTLLISTFFLYLVSAPRLHALDIPNLPAVTKPVAGTVIVPPDAAIRIVTHRGEWSAFFSTGGGDAPFFLIAGQLENTSGKPLRYVKLQFELLNKDGVVVHRDYGYNRQAEALREEDYEKGKKSLEEMKIDSVAADAQDGLRFFFFQDETPEFASYRIRVLESR
ncbi:MAG: hypothetical protein HOP18_20495 [Deltaproteobacteria bacterium]|nr:hypothetical protein [Deltaproteobacteria bacterium]